MKKTNNKGFSLVELIVVIAIMAVLVGILAPQFLRYVEKSKLQKDNTAISEIANAAKVAMADEDIAATPGTSAWTTASNTFTFGTTDALETELNKVVGGTVELKSKTYDGKTVTITVANASGKVTVTVDGYIPKVDGAAKSQTF